MNVPIRLCRNDGHPVKNRWTENWKYEKAQGANRPMTAKVSFYRLACCPWPGKSKFYHCILTVLYFLIFFVIFDVVRFCNYCGIAIRQSCCYAFLTVCGDLMVTEWRRSGLGIGPSRSASCLAHWCGAGGFGTARRCSAGHGVGDKRGISTSCWSSLSNHQIYLQ